MSYIKILDNELTRSNHQTLSKNKKIKLNQHNIASILATDHSMHNQSMSQNSSATNLRYLKLIKESNRSIPIGNQTTQEPFSIQLHIQRVSNYLEALCTDTEVTQSMEIILQYIFNLEGKYRVLQKELVEQSSLNQYHLISRHQKETQLQQILKENVDLKSQQQKLQIQLNNAHSAIHNNPASGSNNQRSLSMDKKPLLSFKLPNLQKQTTEQKFAKKNISIKIQTPRGSSNGGQQQHQPPVDSFNQAGHAASSQRVETEVNTPGLEDNITIPMNAIAEQTIPLIEGRSHSVSLFEPDSPQRLNKINQKKKTNSIYLGEPFIDKSIAQQHQFAQQQQQQQQ